MKINKNGFTLVELLAVIVILALLMVVATSVIGNIQKNSKQSLLKTEAKKLLKKTMDDIQLYKINLSAQQAFTYAKVTPGQNSHKFEYVLEKGKRGVELIDNNYTMFVYVNLVTFNVDYACINDKDGNYMAGTVKSDFSFDTSIIEGDYKYANGSGCVCRNTIHTGLKKISDTNQACNP